MNTGTGTTASLREEIEGLRRLTVAQLKDKHLELFGDASKSNHKQFLFRRIAWRVQANALGGLSERARHRAMEIANDSDLRIRAPKNFLKHAPDETRTESKLAPNHDPRLPAPGSLLVRRYQGKDIVVAVRTNGFEWGGELHRSLSSAVRAATGTPWNGFTFFGLGERPGRTR